MLVSATGLSDAQSSPTVDHHQHLFSPALSALLASPPTRAQVPSIAASELIALLDTAGIRRAVVLSAAYLYSTPGRSVTDEPAAVRRENDWTAAQTALYPDRLVAFCGVNPLKDHALNELARCAADPRLKRGIKLHIGNSDVRLDDPANVDRLKAVFAAANAQRMAIVIHLRANIGRKRPYGAAEAQTFLERVLPAAPNVPVQIAHLGGSGPGFEDEQAQEVIKVLAEAVERKEPRAMNLWFDVATIVTPDTPASTLDLIARRLRQIGMDRILWVRRSGGRKFAPARSLVCFSPTAADRARVLDSGWQRGSVPELTLLDGVRTWTR